MTNTLRKALEQIKRRAFSDAPAEELEDAQRDLRHIFAIADAALAAPPTPDYAAGYAAAKNDAEKAAGEAAWKHIGDDNYSRGLDKGAVEQVKACVAAIRALPVPAGPWRPISEDDKHGRQVLLWVIHENAKYSKAPVDEGWAAACVGSWTTFNGGGWTWNGLCGVPTLVAELPSPP